ncbi:MAG: ATP-dependent exonuclease SbcCD, C subunit-like protein [Leptospiraceae bacterium]|nr:ATP-dependent exonuclease SbcCD, C subunit-like protein [Leptospiraceae bacterium]
MQNELLEFAKDNSKTGFRLERFEVLNWGTFNQKVWKIEPLGFNSLLVGEIGSGKSTLVDGITALLIQNKKITYNKAAGAERKERTLESYVLGAYGSLKGEEVSNPKPQHLRDNSSYSVLLGSFYNSGYNLRYTLAQVFWLKDNSVQKFFLIANTDLKIKEHFTSFGTKISELRKRLQKMNGVEILDDYKHYSSRFCTYFGIRSDKALDLFYQTVSLKTISNLTEFIRENMLEKNLEETNNEIEDLKNHFNDLNLSHEAIIKAKKQIQELTPVIEKSDDHSKLQDQISESNKLLDSLPSFFAEKKISYYKSEIEKQSLEKNKIEYRIEEIEKEIFTYNGKKDSIKSQISSLDEVREKERLEFELESLKKDMAFKKEPANRYNQFAKELNFSEFPEMEEKDFFDTIEKTNTLLPKEKTVLDSLKEEQLKFKIRQDKNNTIIQNIKTELNSLKERKSLIPIENMRIRQFISSELDIRIEEIPFVGELMKVTDKKWEGAIERVLHNFALSILVPDKIYPGFSKFINENSLKGRVVYYRIIAIKRKNEYQSSKNTLYEKIEIKDDTEFLNWLESEIKENYNYSCAESIEDFQKQSKVITREGQIKYSQSRHEKDDRRNINDKSNYVLGWNNKEKIHSLEKDLLQMEEENKDLEDKISQGEKGLKRIEKRILSLENILEFKDYHELNWKKIAIEIKALKEKLLEFTNSSDKLKTLTEILNEITNKLNDFEKNKTIEVEKLGGLKEKINELNKKLSDNETYLNFLTKNEKDIYFPKLESRIVFNTLEIHLIEQEEKKLRFEIDSELKKWDASIREIEKNLIRLMANFKRSYPTETNDFDASIESIPEFKQLFGKLKEEDLPRYEEDFKKKLNKEIIGKIALFKEFLELKAREIKTKIGEINRSLKDIEYNRGTYIILNLDKTNDDEINRFQASLKNCLSDSVVTKTEFYDEERFEKVKAIIDRLSSGVESERKWREKVTDVTRWYEFSATEKYLSDDSEKESYSGASGKSGGQKEKLAYTVLASALAYQFGLEWNETRSNTFRFVVIDEAFGRGSDESTRYGLELFKKLNLQLLIVTPLQKIHIIEEYISACHLVTNKEGKNSSIKNLTIEEYRLEKEKTNST